MTHRRTTGEATAAPAVVPTPGAAPPRALPHPVARGVQRGRGALAATLGVTLTLLVSGCAPDASTPPAAVASAPTQASAPQPSTPPISPTPTVLPDPPAVPPIPLSDAGLSAQHPVATVEPVRVEVPSLGIDVTVAAEGLDDNGALALPADPGIASWYRFGPSPWSASGATVIAAHVDSLEYGLGSFARLTDAAPGTPVAVTAADGRVSTFAVQRVTMADKTGIDWAQVFDRTGPVRLTLITCGGEFDYDTGHYLSNVIVTAAPTG